MKTPKVGDADLRQSLASVPATRHSDTPPENLRQSVDFLSCPALASQLQYWAVHWATWASFLKLYCLKNIHSSGQCDVGNFWIQPVKSGRHKYYYQGLPGGPGKWGKDVQVSFQIQAIQLQTQDAEWTVLERDGAVSLLLPGVTFRKSCMSSSLLGEIYASPYQVLL